MERIKVLNNKANHNNSKAKCEIEEISKQLITDLYVKFLSDNNIVHPKLLSTLTCCDVTSKSERHEELYNALDTGFSVFFSDGDTSISIQTQYICHDTCDMAESQEVIIDNERMYYQYDFCCRGEVIFCTGDDPDEDYADKEGYRKKINKIKKDKDLKLIVKKFIPQLQNLFDKLPSL